jgi:hypothetical protein
MCYSPNVLLRPHMSSDLRLQCHLQFGYLLFEHGVQEGLVARAAMQY